MYALQADARVPDHLIEAGLMMPNCKAVVALTGDEDLNVKISVTARLLNPDARVITQSTHEVYDETLETLGGDVHIIDPFQTYARYLGGTIHNPLIHMLNEWLIGAAGANLAMYPDVPRGTWIVCGFGRMGRCIDESLTALGISTVVIDPDINPGEAARRDDRIAGRASQAALLEAGIKEAAGIVVGTNSDPANLSVVLNARALNPGIFVLVRQNRHRNQMLFSAAEADLIMQPSLVSARRILFQLIAPLLRTFFEHLREHPLDARDVFLRNVVEQLHDRVGGSNPRLWTIALREETAPALMARFREGSIITLGEIIRDPTDRGRHLPCVPMVIRSDRRVIIMPALSHVVEAGDQILFCGRREAYHLLDATLHDEYTLDYLISGVDEPRGYVMKWVVNRFFPPRAPLRP
jgi:Trk K+ transport system NAD-binding subunit